MVTETDYNNMPVIEMAVVNKQESNCNKVPVTVVDRLHQV